MTICAIHLLPGKTMPSTHIFTLPLPNDHPPFRSSINGATFKRFMDDTEFWTNSGTDNLWCDDEMVLVQPVPHMPDWNKVTAEHYSDIDDHAQVKMVSGHVANKDGFQGSLDAMLNVWVRYDVEKRIVRERQILRETLGTLPSLPSLGSSLTRKRL